MLSHGLIPIGGCISFPFAISAKFFLFVMCNARAQHNIDRHIWVCRHMRAQYLLYWDVLDDYFLMFRSLRMNARACLLCCC